MKMVKVLEVLEEEDSDEDVDDEDGTFVATSKGSDWVFSSPLF